MLELGWVSSCGDEGVGEDDDGARDIFEGGEKGVEEFELRVRGIYVAASYNSLINGATACVGRSIP